ncbi:hypothetical protein ACFPWQ_13930 [Cryobacterium melibiosiphilum]
MRPGTRDALLIGLVGFTLAVAFSWVPSLWYDEAATVTGATRSWSQLAEMLTSVDAVHGLFYALMHVWFDLVGYTPFTLRLPSALATGVAAGLLVLFVRRFAPRGTAVLAGLLFCLLPRITWMGEEGRSFALSTVFALLLTLVFLAASRRSAEAAGAAPGPVSARRVWVRGRWWLLYAMLAIVATTLFLYVCLVVVAHGVTAVSTLIAARRAAGRIDAGRVRGGWAALRGWAAASIVAGLVLLPFVDEVVGQASQVGWIKEIGATTFDDIVVVQWFLFNPTFAAFGWVLILGGLAVLGIRAWRSRGAASRTTASAPGMPSLLALVVPWLVVPTLALIVLSLVMTPVFSPRYLAFSAPAAAILMAVAVCALPRRWLRVTAVLACVALTAPGYVAQRLPEAKQNSSWNEVADLIAAERALEPAGAGEAIIYGPVRQHPSATTRVIAYSYPDAFAGLVDVKLRTPAAETGQLWETRYPIDEVTDRFAGMDTVWLVTSNKQDWRPSVTAKLAVLGYGLDTEWNLTGVNVLRFEK